MVGLDKRWQQTKVRKARDELSLFGSACSRDVQRVDLVGETLD